MAMDGFDSDDHCIYFCGQESLRINEDPLIVNQRVWNALFGRSLKHDKMILVCFQGKPLNITVIQIYAPNTDAKEAQIDHFCEDLQHLLELTPKLDTLFIIGDWNAKVGSRDTWQVWPWSTK